MTICGSQSCACALRSDTLTISGAGTPGSPWVIEQVGFTDLTQLQEDVDNLEASMTTVLANIIALQTLTAAHSTSIDRLDAMQMGATTATSGTTSGTTPLTVDTATLSTLPVAGSLWVIGAVVFTKTVASDTFSVTNRVNSTAMTTPMRDVAGASTGSVVTFGGPSAVSASTTPTVDCQLTRLTGTGTATITSGTVRWLFLPT